MNLIYRKPRRNVCYFYPNTKDEKSPICISMSIFFSRTISYRHYQVMHQCNRYLNLRDASLGAL